jgi:hypothetical protein
MAKQITALHQPADVLAVADYNVIPQKLYGKGGEKAYANWYVGFASNAINFVYTDKSEGASKINPGNWYQVLAEPGIPIPPETLSMRRYDPSRCNASCMFKRKFSERACKSVRFRSGWVHKREVPGDP